MNSKLGQKIERREDGKWYIRFDWYSGPLPKTLEAENMAYLDSAYSWANFHSEVPGGFRMGFASGNYLHSHFFAGESGKIIIGKYVILEATNFLVQDSVSVGDHCMFSWGSFITDSWVDENTLNPESRKEILRNAAFSKTRILKIPNPVKVIIEDNVWVGFDAVVLPGTRLGRGCVIGCKTVVSGNIPPYVVVVGNPPEIVKFLEPDDTDMVRSKALIKFVNKSYHGEL
jgi:acetyltransferase-like isoleucine patch superfamily enzyme